jgi:hypothetical protein
MALEFLVRQDGEIGETDGVIENSQHNTYDINFEGANTFVGSLYLAALRAGEEMARAMNEPETAARYRRLFDQGSDWTSRHLFNGEYFEQDPPEGAGDWQYGAGCLADQVFGQNWARLLDLGPVYDEDHVRMALASVYRYNWTPDVRGYNEKHPPERWFARAGDGGLFICTWPNGGRPNQPVRYRDEVWTGIEYQAAAGMIWEGLVDEALIILRAVDVRYDGANHNPWNEVECGDHYARALASWGALHALAGFTWNGPEGKLTISPRVQQEDFSCFFSTGTGWGVITQKREAGRQTNEVRVKWGSVRLSSVWSQVGAEPNSLAVRINGAEVTASLSYADHRVGATLESPAMLNAADTLVVTFG